MDRATHWQAVYQSKSPAAVSWFKPHLEVSLALLEQAGLNPDSRIIDVGAGASTLVDDLLELGVRHITALDISAAALDAARARLGPRAAGVTWLVADIAHASLPSEGFDLWHDRAALHFLVDPTDTAAYVATATQAIRSGGHAVIGCFAADGPEKCSNLPVVRRRPAEIAALFGAAFTLVYSQHELHATPSGVPQPFAYALLRKLERPRQAAEPSRPSR